jgi:hypothetical protein
MSETVTGECIQKIGPDELHKYSLPRTSVPLVKRLNGYLVVIKLRDESLFERLWPPIKFRPPEYIRDVVCQTEFEEGEEVTLEIEEFGEYLHVEQGCLINHYDA